MAESDGFQEVYQQLRISQDKYVYTLLAAAGAAIGLAVSQTNNAMLEWVHAPVGGAVLCWGISFFCGTRTLAYTAASLRANAVALKIEAGEEPTVPRHPDAITAALSGAASAFKFNSERANTYALAQFRFLILGGILYFFWHVLGMWVRTLDAVSV